MIQLLRLCVALLTASHAFGWDTWHMGTESDVVQHYGNASLSPRDELATVPQLERRACASGYSCPNGQCVDITGHCCNSGAVCSGSQQCCGAGCCNAINEQCCGGGCIPSTSKCCLGSSGDFVCDYSEQCCLQDHCAPALGECCGAGHCDYPNLCYIWIRTGQLTCCSDKKCTAVYQNGVISSFLTTYSYTWRYTYYSFYYITAELTSTRLIYTTSFTIQDVAQASADAQYSSFTAVAEAGLTSALQTAPSTTPVLRTTSQAPARTLTSPSSELAIGTLSTPPTVTSPATLTQPATVQSGRPSYTAGGNAGLPTGQGTVSFASHNSVWLIVAAAFAMCVF